MENSSNEIKILLYSLNAASQILGLNILTCVYHKNSWNFRFFKFYSNFLELFLILNTLALVSTIFSDKFVCGDLFNLFVGFKYIMQFFVIGTIIFWTFQFSLLKRIHLNLPSKSCYEVEKTLITSIEFQFAVFFAVTALLQVTCYFMLDFSLYSAVENATVTEFLLCNIDWALSSFFLIGQTVYILFLLYNYLLILFHGFNTLSSKLDVVSRERRKSKVLIVYIIEEHTALMEDVRNVNNQFEMYFPAVYCCNLYAFSILVTISLFYDLPAESKLGALVIIIFVILEFLIISFGLSRFTSSLYGNFNEINKYSSYRFSLVFKLKMLNFMKRFGKTPIGISVGGFFRVKRDFPIKMLSSLYSILSALIELAKKNESTKCTSSRLLNASNVQNTSLY
ncbi:uncharacterized protein LOC111628409 [Centruroides sculpturatus]|uniref:uncharacterized protein LOC111628409 n=1 Tax=Centruroides sculpturatus TaxID=218467 RepID=UPI000C6ECD5E|nr:uncharacterized protein LOC111628409 [Centruroides sculpturatus]XP_023227961.1 uncharacterized protein LOC111628409 [Centruroides sculpturatus]